MFAFLIQEHSYEWTWNVGGLKAQLPLSAQGNALGLGKFVSLSP